MILGASSMEPFYFTLFGRKRLQTAPKAAGEALSNRASVGLCFTRGLDNMYFIGSLIPSVILLLTFVNASSMFPADLCVYGLRADGDSRALWLNDTSSSRLMSPGLNKRIPVHNLS
jgi:hypothetical protein